MSETQNNKGINIEDIMKQIKERVRHKREMGIYSDKDIEELYSLNLSGAQSDCKEGGRLKEQIRLLNDCYDFRSGINITSHRPILGKIIVPMKKIFIALAVKLAAPLFDKQVSFNFHLLRTIYLLNRELEALKNEQSRVMLKNEKKAKPFNEPLDKSEGKKEL